LLLGFANIFKYDSVVMPSKIRSDILAMLREDAAPPSMLSQMDAEMGHTFANAIHIFTHKHGIALDDIDMIGSGGQLITLTGSPPHGQHRSNMCLGEGAVISAKPLGDREHHCSHISWAYCCTILHGSRSV
jgi:1,6-anhydro-N-acetylmuramate kinase